jgi:hypothetical protein
MPKATLALVSVVYVITSYGYYAERQPGHAFAFLCYALANVGFILEGHGG